MKIAWWLTVVICAQAHAQGLPPNRGTQLFVVLHTAADWRVVPISEHRDYVMQRWHEEKGTYDFVLAEVTTRTPRGCKVGFTRFVMGEDYVAKTDHAELSFLYAEQPRYHFFDAGVIVGFYRNSPEDLSPEEFLRHKPPNR